MERLHVDGKFLRAGERRVFLRMVTYGPFPGGWPRELDEEFARIREAGFDSLRLYEWPDQRLLDAAEGAGLWVFAGLRWAQSVDFLSEDRLAEGFAALSSGLAEGGGHPALAGVFVANEVPADLVRWMGVGRVRKVIEQLIARGRESCPELIWCYGNYPATEYLETGNADITAMNIYLEKEDEFRAYLTRLHHIAGDRPVLISEFGLDSRRNGTDRQAECLNWAMRASFEAGTAGMTVYAWSDRWWNAGAEVLDWDFGLTDREGRNKPALAALRKTDTDNASAHSHPSFSVIICTHNGEDRIGHCLRAVASLQNTDYETIVVDDGSTDRTAERIRKEFPEVRLIRIEHAGLSAARNAGAEAAQGALLAFTDDDCEPDAMWLAEVVRCFDEGFDAVGGPNLPPPPTNRTEAIVAAAPGAASHVMIDDREAEHIPGCNLVVRRTSYFAIGGFDGDFRTAGDDVDFCWRLRDAGMRIGFSPTAFVWHHRRPSIRAYLRQQTGYGRAEAMLMMKHPARFSPSGDAIWHGTIYTGAPVRATGQAVIYHGPMGLSGYQGVTTRMQPLRELDQRYNSGPSRMLLECISWLAPRLRSHARIGRFRGPLKTEAIVPDFPDAEFGVWNGEERVDLLKQLLDSGWRAGGANDSWDLERDGTRLLIATERGEGGKRRTLYRIWGDPGLVPELREADRLGET
ncbi:MAG: glycosyltransferase [Verrucomicrobiota bacterium]